MTRTKDPPSYTAYLLRCWLEGSSWRYSLQEVGSAHPLGFATLDELVSFLVAHSTLPVESELAGGEISPEVINPTSFVPRGGEGGSMELS